MWLWAFIACSDTTNEHRMVGRIADSAGEPLSGVSVQSVEARTETDETGAFGVVYQAPSTYVEFRVGATRFQRHYREADRDTEVEVRLPPMRDTALTCAAPEPCTALLQWDLPEGLIGRVVLRCEPDKEVPAARIPEGAPKVSCQTDVRMPTEQAWLHDTGDHLVIGGVAFGVRVQVRSSRLPGDTAPEDCEVWVGPKRAEAAGDGWFTALGTGTTTVRATCDGRPATPRQIEVKPNSRVVLHWTEQGPVLDLEKPIPWAHELTLISEEGWELLLTSDKKGYFELPALRAGRYRFVGSARQSPAIAALPFPEPAEPGVLTLIPPDEEGEAPFVGYLILDRALESGTLPVRTP